MSSKKQHRKLKHTIAALLNAPDALGGFSALIPKGHSRQERAPARLVLKLPFLRPGAYASKVQCPILFGVCGTDSVAPAAATMAYAKMSPRGLIKMYADVGHFEIYLGEPFEKAMQDYKQFLLEHAPIEVL